MIALLFKQYWKGDEEIDEEPVHEIIAKYSEVSTHDYEFVTWPFIRVPDEEWCGDWRDRRALEGK